MEVQELVERINTCPVGHAGWHEFEDACIAILIHLFVPPLTRPRLQARTLSGAERRDAIFPNRNFDLSNIWGQIGHELNARFILFEFKNHDKQSITTRDVNQAKDYLTPNMGNLGIICSTRPPSKNARRLRNSIYSRERKMVLFLSKEQLIEMLFAKERGEDPAGLIMDMVEDFLLQHD